MAKYYGVIGYGETSEVSPGIWADTIVERKYYGDVIKNIRRLGGGDKVNPNITVSNQISVVADAYANTQFFAIRYISWMGNLWTVSEVEVERPRLILTLGGVYDGPTPEAP